MIRLNNVTKRFGNEVVAVDNVSMEFEDGKFYAIMGPSGSGKSTILNMIGGLEKVTSGNVEVNGADITEMNYNEKADMRLNNMGYIFQSFYLNPYLNALDNVIVPMEINKRIARKDRKVRAEELLKKVGLEERVKHFPNQMSGGEQQRTAIARALANCDTCEEGSFIILADEPTGNLDEENEIQIFSMLRDMTKEGKTVIAVSHNDLIKEYADCVIYIKKGRIVND